MTTPKNPDESSEEKPLTGSAPQSGQESGASLSKKPEESEPTGTEWATPASAQPVPGESTQLSSATGGTEAPSESSATSGGGPSSSSGSATEPPVTGSAPQSTGPEGWNQPGAGQPEYPFGGQPGYPGAGPASYPGEQPGGQYGQPGYSSGQPGYPGGEKPGEQSYPGGQGYPPGGPSSYSTSDQADYPSAQPQYGQSQYGGAYPQGQGGYPSYPQQGQPFGGEQPRKPGTQTMSIIGFVCAVLALFLCPILFGPAGIVFGILGHNKGEPLGRWAAIAAGAALVIGLILSFAVLNTDFVPEQN
ncbi:hypothetical protein [Nocardia bhagyanarayanae]|uniref:DUF4190 domain-containing protein n=1 Tax=Nocardia bhagyanarayanae TaxID=1215925 RepID=A0A543F9Q4_9NOCA|nr:hypothetical protein [Nocardia bhagyanarayanae]TQM30562.1 hypothetical protein FB390_2190 [Nocardia bhagyanarayanae]